MKADQPVKWIIRLIVLGAIGYAGLATYDLHRRGFFNLPELPHGAYTISFESGFRGIVQGIEVADDHNADSPALLRELARANPDRQYIGFGTEVPSWFQEAWSSCAPPTAEERAYFETNMPDDMKKTVQGARLDALCFINTDNEQRFLRGALYSVPKL
jgi:hypothetical protein